MKRNKIGKRRLLSASLSALLALSLALPVAAAPQFGSRPVAPSVVETPALSAELAQFDAERAEMIANPRLDRRLAGLTGGKVNVIVELSAAPVALAQGLAADAGQAFGTNARVAAVNQIAAQQRGFYTALQADGIGYTENLTYDTVLNAVALTVDADALTRLLAVPGVMGVWLDAEVALDPAERASAAGLAEVLASGITPNMNVSTDYLGVEDVWAAGYRGEGIKVGVIDTGVDYYHPDLVDAFVGGYDFVDEDEDPYETTPEDWASDPDPTKGPLAKYVTDHGTHVSGTIVAEENGDLGVKGIAPDADLYVYRVLGPGGSGVNSWVNGGIERAVEDGMDVINLSLGTSTNDAEYITSVALNNAMLAGTIAVTSAGNTGPNLWTLGSPGAAAFAITVGASSVPSEAIFGKAEFYGVGGGEGPSDGVEFGPVLPAVNRNLNAGYSVMIAFDAESGLQSPRFAINLPTAERNVAGTLSTTQPPVTLPMMETTDGHYVGYYTATGNVVAAGAEIEITASKAGRAYRTIAPGKLWINTPDDDHDGEPGTADPGTPQPGLPGNQEIDVLEPAADIYRMSGKSIQVVAEGATGQTATFKLKMPLADLSSEDAAAGFGTQGELDDPNYVAMMETTSGHYEGNYTVTTEIVAPDVVIEVRFQDKVTGKVVYDEAPGRVNLNIEGTDEPRPDPEDPENPGEPGVVYTVARSDFMTWSPAARPDSLTGRYAVKAAGYGNPDEFAGDYAGKIALIARGDGVTFVDKIANAKAAGAIGTIIYNDVPGPMNMVLGDGFDMIPSYSLTGEQGLEIVALLAANPELTVQFSAFESIPTAGDDIADFSSRGPAMKTLDLKPEVAAPGVNIFSTKPMYAEGADYSQAYQRMSGTSMASPHIAGVAALLQDKFPDATPFDIKSLLMNNGVVLDTERYDVFAQGAGRVQADQAAFATDIFYVDAVTRYGGEDHQNLTSTVNFGNHTGEAVDETITIERKTLEGEGTDTYTVAHTPTKQIAGAEVTVTANADGGGYDVNLTITEDLTALTNATLEGYIHLTSAATGKVINVPYLAYINYTLVGIKEIVAVKGEGQTIAHFPANMDGMRGEALDFEVEAYNDMTILEYGLFNSLTGQKVEGIVHQVFDEGTVVLPADERITYAWNGTYTTDLGETFIDTEDGLYEMTLMAADANNNTYSDFTRIPFFMKTTAPVINVPNSVIVGDDGLFSGTVEDLYVDAVNVMKSEYGFPIEVKDMLDASYFVMNDAGELLDEGMFEVGQTGEWSITLADTLPIGEYTMMIVVADEQNLTGTKMVNLTKIEGETPQPEGPIIEIITPKDNEVIEGSVIHVTGTVTGRAADNVDVVLDPASSNAKRLAVLPAEVPPVLTEEFEQVFDNVAPGEHVVEVTAVDYAGNMAVERVYVTVYPEGGVPEPEPEPDVAITYPLATDRMHGTQSMVMGTYAENITSVVVRDHAGNEVAAQLGGGMFTAAPMMLYETDDNRNTFTVIGIDAEGNTVATDTVTANVIYTVGPRIEVDTPQPNEVIVGTEVRLKGRVSDRHPGFFFVGIMQAVGEEGKKYTPLVAKASEEAPEVQVFDFDDMVPVNPGEAFVNIMAVDEFGNQRDLMYPITIVAPPAEETGPEIVILTPSPAEEITGTQLSVTGTVTGNEVDDVVVTVTPVGAGKASGISKRVALETSDFETNFAAAPGEYLVTVKAVDGAGKEAVKTVTVTVVAGNSDGPKFAPIRPSIPGKLQ